MLQAKFTQDAELPQVGSVGYLRGTGQRARVLQRIEPEQPGEPRECLAKLFDWVPATRFRQGFWTPATGSSGNTRVAEADLYPTEEAAEHAGRKPPALGPCRRRAAR